MVKPISPKDVVQAKHDSLPDEVMRAFNTLIAERWDGHSSYIKQGEVVKLIVESLEKNPTYQDLNPEKIRKLIFEKGWLDVEGVFRKVGWKVEFDRPGYNETYEAHYTFTGKRGLIQE
jgi:ABC-type transport system substrate-binding protein